ncbi:hypothetical protein HDU78_001807 [Chytriomyces hyalinus]|nr:hypothetical protein HDU78_001807 [Chytriomyces hyalinus]
MYRIFLALLYITPVTCLLPSVLKFCALYFKNTEYERYVNIGNLMSGGVVTATDLFFAFAFYSYLVKYTKMTTDDSTYGNTNGLKLQAIALYGLISSCFCFFALAGIVSIMMASFLDPRMENPYSRVIYLVGYIVVDIGSFALCLTPILMKVRLHQLGMQAAVHINAPGDKSHGLEGEGVAFMQKLRMSSNRTNADSSQKGINQ